MYIITDHRSETPFVITGPSEWRSKYFSFILSEELDENIVITEQDKERVPFFIRDGIAIRECEVVYEEINTAFQVYEGPSISFVENGSSIGSAIATYTAVFKDLELLKKEIRDIAAQDRWKNENLLIKIDLGEEQYYVSCSRESRDALTQKYITMDENSTVQWKFKHRWAAVTKADILDILKKIDEHVQNEFNKEIDLVSLLDAASNVDDIKNIALQRENTP